MDTFQNMNRLSLIEPESIRSKPSNYKKYCQQIIDNEKQMLWQKRLPALQAAVIKVMSLHSINIFVCKSIVTISIIVFGSIFIVGWLCCCDMFWWYVCCLIINGLEYPFCFILFKTFYLFMFGDKIWYRDLCKNNCFVL